MNTLFRYCFVALLLGAGFVQAAEPAHDHSHPQAAPVVTAAPNMAMNHEACHMKPEGKPGTGGLLKPMSARPGMAPRCDKKGAPKPCKHCPEAQLAAGEHCAMHPSAAPCPKYEAVQQRLNAIEQRLEALERAAKPTTGA